MIRVIGGGPGDIKYLTLDAYEKIKTADYVVAFSRISEDIQSLNENIIKVQRVDQVIEEIAKLEDKDVAIVASGDSCFYGIVDLLIRKGINITEVVPGISSVQYFFNRLKKSYSHIETQSVHGRDFDFSKIDKSNNYSFLIDQEKGANFISRELNNLAFKGKLYCGYNLSYEDEEIFIINIGDEIEEPSSLGVVVTDFYVD